MSTKKSTVPRPDHCEDCPSLGKGVFCELEKTALDGVSHTKVTNVYKKGQTLFVEGTPPFGIFCISQGTVKLTKNMTTGKEILVRMANAGDILGHRSLFSDEHYQATATAMEDTSVCFIDRKYIIDLVKKEPTVAANLIFKLGHQLGASESRVASLANKSVRERAAEVLLILLQSHGQKTEEGIAITLPITREELAGLVGTATETLIRTLSEFKEEGLIADKGKQLVVLNRENLTEVASINS
jgi:CRP-like cAMP-binding protein